MLVYGGCINYNRSLSTSPNLDGNSSLRLNPKRTNVLQSVQSPQIRNGNLPAVLSSVSDSSPDARYCGARISDLKVASSVDSGVSTVLTLNSLE